MFKRQKKDDLQQIKSSISDEDRDIEYEEEDEEVVDPRPRRKPVKKDDQELSVRETLDVIQGNLQRTYNAFLLFRQKFDV